MVDPVKCIICGEKPRIIKPFLFWRDYRVVCEDNDLSTRHKVEAGSYILETAINTWNSFNKKRERE